MDCGVPVLQQRLPARQPDPRLERPRAPRRLARCDRAAARDQQLPRVHRPDLPGPVRVRLRARHHRRPGDDQADRVRDRRSGPSTRAGSSPRPPPPAPVARSGSSAPVPPGWRLPPSSTLSATRSPSTSATRRVGGLMRFGVPDAKLEKWMIDRRVELLEAEGVSFECGVDVGATVEHRGAARAPRRGRDRDRLAGRARPRGAGRELDGVHFAMDYLYQRNRWVARASKAARRARARARDHGRRQARGRDRRRRHRHGLHLQRQPRGRAQRRPCSTSTPSSPTAVATPTLPGRCRRSARSPPTRSTRAASGASAIR